MGSLEREAVTRRVALIQNQVITTLDLRNSYSYQVRAILDDPSPNIDLKDSKVCASCLLAKYPNSNTFDSP